MGRPAYSGPAPPLKGHTVKTQKQKQIVTQLAAALDAGGYVYELEQHDIFVCFYIEVDDWEPARIYLTPRGTRFYFESYAGSEWEGYISVRDTAAAVAELLTLVPAKKGA